MNLKEKFDKMMRLAPENSDEIAVWMVRGPDTNPDLGGTHIMPVLGFVRGTYSQAVDWAIRRDAFEDYGLGDITRINVIDFSGAIKFKSPEYHAAVVNHFKAVSYNMISKSGVKLPGLVSLLQHNLDGVLVMAVDYFEADQGSAVDDFRELTRYFGAASSVEDLLRRIGTAFVEGI